MHAGGCNCGETMDYHKNRKILRIIVFSVFIVLSGCESPDRDIILTPKQAAQVKGRSLYYRPEEDLKHEPGVRVPWEQILKHLTYVTLYGTPYERNQISADNVDYKQFMNASYIIHTNNIVTNFGDIITLAEGHVEKLTDKYQFIEGKCSSGERQKCSEKNTIAQWIVQKIRHRDGEKKFRYEIKFSINPYQQAQDREDLQGRGEDENGKRVARQFILRDFDYPESFLWFDEHVSQQRLEENRRYLERLHRFNEIFTQAIYIDSNFYTSDNPIIPQLNFGEFLREPIQQRQSLTYQYVEPTTYRPNYHVKFSRPPLTYDVPNERNVFPAGAPVKAHHLHHHYYITNNNVEATQNPYHLNLGINPTIRTPFDYVPTPPPIKHQIPIPPNFNNHLTQTPLPIQLTSPIIPSPPLIFPQYPTVASITSRPDLIRNLAQNVVQNVAQNLAIPQYQLTQQIIPSVQPFLYNFQVTSVPTLQQDYFQRVKPTQPFIESPREENIRFSEPDPLYKNQNTVKQHQSRPEVPTTNVEQTTHFEGFEQTNFNQPNKDDFRPQQENNIRSHSNESPTFTASSVGDTISEVEKPSQVDQSTEQNQVVERPHDPVNAQLPPPESENHQDNTVTYMDIPTGEGSTASSESSHSNRPQQLDSSFDASKHQEPPIESVEITHLSQPVDPPKIDEQPIHTAPELPPFPSSTTSRSVSSVEAIPASSPRTNLIGNDDLLHITKGEAHYKSSSERPVLRWKPKRPRLKTRPNGNDHDATIIIAKTRRINKLPLKIETGVSDSGVIIERIPDEDTIQKIYKLTTTTTESGMKQESKTNSSLPSFSSPSSPSSSLSDEVDVPTKQSFSTSISIKVGTSKEQPFLPTVSLPSIELYKANLEPFNTNSSLIKFFKASDKNEKSSRVGDEVDKVITRSIVEHATRLAA